MPKYYVPVIVATIILAVLLAFGTRFYKIIPPGHVGVAVLFGKPNDDPFREGLYVPVNPFYDWTLYDARQKEIKEVANVPSQDQLQTKIDISVVYRINGNMAARILQETGDAQLAVDVHLVPKLRSLMREQGKSIRRAEDFFLETTQDQLQTLIFEGLRDYLEPKGIIVEAVLIRDITLPPFISRAIEAKKEREQEVEKQKAELERFRTEQQQLIASAEAERLAAEESAQRRRLLADAQAYEIERLNEAIQGNPAYLQLQALEALKAISSDPSAKLYFLDGNSPMPIPFMNIGEPLQSGR